jgi:hypothetical protein
MALGSTQPLTEMSTRSISWGKGGRCVRLTTYHHSVPLSRNLGTLTSWNPLRPSGPLATLHYSPPWNSMAVLCELNICNATKQQLLLGAFASEK